MIDDFCVLLHIRLHSRGIVLSCFLLKKAHAIVNKLQLQTLIKPSYLNPPTWNFDQ